MLNSLRPAWAAAAFAAAACLIPGQARADAVDDALAQLRPAIAIIEEVETGGVPEAKRDVALGDSVKDKAGRVIRWRARGRYQLHKIYWIDAGFPADEWEAGAFDRQRSEQAIARVMLKYCPEAIEAGDWQTIVRIHNGGPRGAARDSTLPYLEKARAAKQRLDERAKR